MGTSVFLTSKNRILQETFRITTAYIPKETDGLGVFDPYVNSIQWSRRFIGLKVYLSLLFYGWKGYEETIDHQIYIGNQLRNGLVKSGWAVKNNTGLPIVCFTDAASGAEGTFAKEILDNIISKGKAWLSIYPINGVPTIRACITNYNTKEKDIDELIKELNYERRAYESKRHKFVV